VPINRVNTLEDLAHDPHLVATGFWKEVDHPSEGRLRTTAFPVNFSGTPARSRVVTRRGSASTRANFCGTRLHGRADRGHAGRRRGCCGQRMTHGD
jgi:crotonobetainyl-CoA:carnitine CoA-transferase CaiB-like acyl-CoA transferase